MSMFAAAALLLSLVGGAGLLLAFAAWVHGNGYQSGYDDAVSTLAKQAREKMERQNKVASRPVSDAELDRSLRDGTF